MTGKCEHLVDGPQDGAYVPCDNSNDSGGNKVPVLEQHKDGNIHIYPPVLLYQWHNTRISFVRDGFNYSDRILPVSEIDDY